MQSNTEHGRRRLIILDCKGLLYSHQPEIIPLNYHGTCLAFLQTTALSLGAWFRLEVWGKCARCVAFRNKLPEFMTQLFLLYWEAGAGSTLIEIYMMTVL